MPGPRAIDPATCAHRHRKCAERRLAEMKTSRGNIGVAIMTPVMTDAHHATIVMASTLKMNST